MDKRVWFIFFLLVIYSIEAIAQFGKVRDTRAVIIGISDYEDVEIPDLLFAHKDAEAFKAFLISDAGGNVPEDNIRLLTNENATGGNIHKALYWLLKEANENDISIIYFSGHGDVETIYADEPGHLLIYDSPSSIYQINSLRIDDLQRIVRTLSDQKLSKVFVYTDACRSGKLAGSEVNGAQATAVALNNQFSNEVKIMSCQPNEYSIEGKEWGGGRGIFSYYLIKGLKGLADEDDNHIVTLKEVERYLDKRIASDLEDFNQTPITLGDKNTKIAFVDLKTLEDLRPKTDNPDPGETLASVDEVKGLGNDQDVLVSKFYEALASKHLLDHPADSANLSAEHYYSEILNIEALAPKLPIFKGDYIAALQDDAQQAINKYLETDAEEMSSRFMGDVSRFNTYPKYLKKAAALLGSNHYLYPQIKTKEIYFDVVAQRIILDRDNGPSTAYAQLNAQLNEALAYQSRSPFIYNELGLIAFHQQKYSLASEFFDQAIEMSPTWALPYHNKAHVFEAMGDYPNAIEYEKKALEQKEGFGPGLEFLAESLRANGQHEEALAEFLRYDRLFPNNCINLNNIGYQYYNLQDLENALQFFDKAIACDNSFASPHLNKSLVYIRQRDYPKAFEELTLAESKGMDEANLYYNFGVCYELTGDLQKAVEYYIKTIDKNPGSQARLDLATIYLKNKEAENAITHFNFYNENVESDYKWSYFDNACAYALLSDLDGFRRNMEMAMKYGFDSKKEMEESVYLSSIRSTDVYQEILAKMK